MTINAEHVRTIEWCLMNIKTKAHPSLAPLPQGIQAQLADFQQKWDECGTFNKRQETFTMVDLKALKQMWATTYIYVSAYNQGTGPDKEKKWAAAGKMLLEYSDGNFIEFRNLVNTPTSFEDWWFRRMDLEQNIMYSQASWVPVYKQYLSSVRMTSFGIEAEEKSLGVGGDSGFDGTHMEDADQQPGISKKENVFYGDRVQSWFSLQTGNKLAANNLNLEPLLLPQGKQLPDSDNQALINSQFTQMVQAVATLGGKHGFEERPAEWTTAETTQLVINSMEFTLKHHDS